ncbi:MAG: 50S ribosomal protein L39e [Candidatus Thermoplasmatota archaeon]|jgi:large subunit ribosomal protein L39e|nr:50S ribosomal protein L39e [Candidatus Thermoplasmatota archaeon]MCL5963449.1 50S ribosomal protein L39e [Candidatus Thermoplasmatota archaeon]
MAHKKSLGKKLRLLKHMKQNQRVPAWVMEKTDRHFMRNPKERSWKRGHLRL